MHSTEVYDYVKLRTPVLFPNCRLWANRRVHRSLNAAQHSPVYKKVLYTIYVKSVVWCVDLT